MHVEQVGPVAVEHFLDGGVEVVLLRDIDWRRSGSPWRSDEIGIRLFLEAGAEIGVAAVAP